MSNPPRKKGTAAETAVVDYLRAHGFEHAERRASHGNTDRGDVAGIPGVVIEVKSVKAITPGPFVDEAEAEARNAAAPVFAAVVKRRGTTDVGRWFILTTVAQWTALVRDDAAVAKVWPLAGEGRG